PCPPPEGEGNYSCTPRRGRNLALVGGVGEQRHVPGPLQRDREAALVAGAGSGDTTRKDLASLAHEAAPARYLLVVDQVDLLDAEVADLLVWFAIALISRWRHGSLSIAPRRGYRPDRHRAPAPRGGWSLRQPPSRPVQQPQPVAAIGCAARGTGSRSRSLRWSCASGRPGLPRTASAAGPRRKPSCPCAGTGRQSPPGSACQCSKPRRCGNRCIPSSRRQAPVH